jgi:hypothetical protein
MLYGTRRALLGGRRRVNYELLAWPLSGTANQNYADGQLLDTVAEGLHAGTLTVVELDGALSVASNALAYTAQATPVWGDLGVYSQAIDRVLGKGILSTGRKDATNTFSPQFNQWRTNQAVTDSGASYAIYFNNAAQIQIRAVTGGTSHFPIVGAYAAATNYDFAIVAGGYDVNGQPWYVGQNPVDYLYGASYFIRGGVFAKYTLLWRTSLDNTATHYAGLAIYNANGTLQNFRVTSGLSAVLQPASLSTMTAANGTLLPAITPEVGGAWTTRSGTFDIQTNRANISVSTGARDVATIEESIADGTFDVVARKTAAVDSGEFGRCLRHTDANNYWMVNADLANNQVELVERNAGIENVRASSAVALTHSTDYDVRAIAYGQTIDIFLNGGNKATYGAAVLNENVTRHGIVGNEVNQTFDNCASYARTSGVYDSVLGGV